MPGTKEGGRKSAITNRLKHPDHYQNIGRKGGVAKVAKGFSMVDPERRKELGRKGGQSERKPRAISDTSSNWDDDRLQPDPDAG